MNEFRQAMAESRLAWLESEYEKLVVGGHVSSPIQQMIDKQGGVRGLEEDCLNSFGDLICRTKEKLMREGRI